MEDVNMPKHISRRKALAAGTLSAGALFATACSKPEQKTPVKATETSFLTPWSPPPDVERDLTPGTTPIRLASWSNKTTLDYPKDIGITEIVKRIRDAGYTSGNAYFSMNNRCPWLEASEAEIAELKKALNEYDVTFFDMHTVGNNIHPDISERQKSLKYVVEACEGAERVGCTMVTTHAGNRSAEAAIAPLTPEEQHVRELQYLTSRIRHLEQRLAKTLGERDTIRGERDDARRLLQNAKEEWRRKNIGGGHGGHRIGVVS